MHILDVLLSEKAACNYLCTHHSETMIPMTNSATGTPIRAAFGPCIVVGIFAPAGDPMPLDIRVEYMVDFCFDTGVLGI